MPNSVHGFAILFCKWDGISFSPLLVFTVQLQHHARHRLPTFQLIFVHVIESLVFVPVSTHFNLFTFVKSFYLNCLVFVLFLILLALLMNCLLISADYDWHSVFSLWVLWWSATCFHGLDSCLVVWTFYSHQVSLSLSLSMYVYILCE